MKSLDISTNGVGMVFKEVITITLEPRMNEKNARRLESLRIWGRYVFLGNRLKSQRWQDQSLSNGGLDAGRSSPRTDCGQAKGSEELNAGVADVS